MKNKSLLIGLAGVLLLGGLAACNTKEDSTIPSESTSTSSESSSSSSKQATQYAVKVYAPTSVTYEINKTKATKGETIVLKIKSIADGYSLASVKLNNTSLTETSANTYSFTMPNQSASIEIKVKVSGQVTINGDFAVALTLNQTTGIYEARNVLVTNGSKDSANISFYSGSTKMNALRLDDTNSFGDISLVSGTENFSIATNTYYDFTYDPSKEGSTDDCAPCTIQRVGVDFNYLPSDVNSLQSMLITSKAIRSNPAIFTNDLVGVDYKVFNKDGSEAEDLIKQTFKWKMYKDNISFGKVVDTDLSDEETNMYVYKKLDKTNKVLSVVDTYRYKNNNLIANDDPTREGYNNYEGYAARYGIIEGDDYDYRRFKKNETHAEETLKTIPHMPAYYLEREIMDAYRVGFEADEKTYDNIVIASEVIDANTFKTTIDTVYELNCNGGTYTSNVHEGHVFDVDITFDVRGAIKSLYYKKTVFDQTKWDFTKHTPLTSTTKGVKAKEITATYTYGTPTETFTASEEFNPDDYFISEISALQIYNENTKKDKTTGNSYADLSDDIMIYNTSCVLDSKVAKFTYAPTTALDIWQYGPVASTNEDVIAKEANDLYCQWSAVGVGDSTVTFGNHLDASQGGTTIDVNINVTSNGLIRGFYLYDVDNTSFGSITNAVTYSVKAGSYHSFQVVNYPSNSALQYTAVSSDSTLAKVTSAPNAKIMTIDFFGSIDIAEATAITITMNATYDPSYGNGSATVFTMYILPADINPLGEWQCLDAQGGLISTMTFTSTAYVSEDSLPDEKIGTIYEDSTSGLIDVKFAWTFNGVSLSARLTSISITPKSGTDTWSTKPSEYEFVVEYHPEANDGKGAYGVGLVEHIYDEYYEDTTASAVYGEVDNQGELVSLDAFIKVED